MSEPIEHGERDYHEQLLLFEEMMFFEENEDLPLSDQFPIVPTDKEIDERE